MFRFMCWVLTKRLVPRVQLPENSGFANSSAKSPFAITAGSGVNNIFGSSGSSSPSSSNLFASSKFGALSGSTASPFGALGGAKSSTASPFGAFGAKGAASGFGSGSAFGSSSSSPGGTGFGSAFGSGAAIKSQPAKKPFGAPEEEEKSDEDDDGSSDDAEDKKAAAHEEDGSAKPLGLKEQEGSFPRQFSVFSCRLFLGFGFDEILQ